MTARLRAASAAWEVARQRVCRRPRVCAQPAWWDAMCKVPPMGLLPRIKKKEVVKLRFLEDRLVRCVAL